MKKIFLLVTALAFIARFSFAEVIEEKKVTPEKFKVTYTIIYNEITLQEAADREILIRQRNKKACSIKTKVEEERQSYLTIP